ncbi:MAG: MATE family efflux transporter [Eubacteriales bacterium]|nr:MATE family efflux transporter [Eubacteriales bacterium]
METKHRKRVMDMTEGKPAGLLLAFALPVFLGNLLQQFYNLADISIAGHLLGDTALAQIGASAALYSMITSFAFGLNTGFALVVSRFFGAGDKRRMSCAAGWMVILAAVWAAVMTAGFLLCRRLLMEALNTPPEVMDGALSYITVILAGIPLTMAYNLETGLMRAVGNSVTPLGFLLLSCGLNVALDYLFMGPLGLGVRGAAAATVLAQGISALMCLGYIIRNYPELRFGLGELRQEAAMWTEILMTGLSMALMNAIFSIGSVILQSSVNALGSVYIAAQVGGRRLVELFMMPGGAISSSSATFASQNYGAGKRGRIAAGARTAFFLYMGWWVIAMIFAVFFAPAAVRLITGSSSAAVMDNALLYIRISIPMFPPMGFLVIMRNVLQGMRHRIAPLLCSSLELIGKMIFGFFLVPVLGYPAVCACEPVTWVICFVFITAAVILWREEFKDREEQQS